LFSEEVGKIQIKIILFFLIFVSILTLGCFGSEVKHWNELTGELNQIREKEMNLILIINDEFVVWFKDSEDSHLFYEKGAFKEVEELNNPALQVCEKGIVKYNNKGGDELLFWESQKNLHGLVEKSNQYTKKAIEFAINGEYSASVAQFDQARVYLDSAVKK
jgi:hypothetical protein